MSVVAPVVPSVTQDDKAAEPKYPELVRAAEIVRERWCQKRFGYLGEQRCVAGAIAEAAPGSIVSYRAFRTWLGREVVSWNDEYGRTAEEVAEALERAAYGL